MPEVTKGPWVTTGCPRGSAHAAVHYQRTTGRSVGNANRQDKWGAEQAEATGGVVNSLGASPEFLAQEMRTWYLKEIMKIWASKLRYRDALGALSAARPRSKQPGTYWQANQTACRRESTECRGEPLPPLQVKRNTPPKNPEVPGYWQAPRATNGAKLVPDVASVQTHNPRAGCKRWGVGK